MPLADEIGVGKLRLRGGADALALEDYPGTATDEEVEKERIGDLG